MPPKVPAPALPPREHPPRPARRRGLWLLPIALTVLMVLGVMMWLRQAEQQERDAQRQELITDALSLQAQIEGRVEAERQRLKDLAHRIGTERLPPAILGAQPEVLQGLHGSWLSITWLDA